MKKFGSLLLASLMLCSVMLGSVLQANADQDVQWKLGSWKSATEDGVEVITAPEGNQYSDIRTKTGVPYNCCEFDIKVLSSTATVDGNIGFIYHMGTTEYFFECNIVTDIMRIRVLGSGDNHITADTPYRLNMNTWVHMKIIAATNYLKWYVDEQLMVEAAVTPDELENGVFSIQGYFCRPSVKNIKVSTVDVPKDPTDLEFRHESSVSAFTDEGGDISWDNGSLVYSFKDGDQLISPELDYPAGHEYSALMPLRSTIFVRMKNDSSASLMKVYFKTSSNPAFDEKKMMEFPIKPNSDYTTYYFNLGACYGTQGYLRGFKLVPEGNGSISIDAISFEREEIPYDYAGNIISCLSDGDDVTVTGKVIDQYADKEITIYETQIDNYTNSISRMTKVCTVKADGTDFCAVFPFMSGKMTRLSSMFAATYNGEFINKQFTIENYRDFTDNPYKFSLPDQTIKVTDAPYNAKGDGFTDDTAAIQQALDDMYRAGGGKVVVPGDALNEYGKRYIVTNIKLRDNTELCIETGATLWQSPRKEDYRYDVVYGHDISLPGINWTHAGLCHNLPLIQGYEAKNIKLTGGGTIRLNDCGSENQDGVSGSIWTGCGSRIHLIAIAMFGCENVEIRDLTVKHANCYHMPIYASSNVYIANMKMSEATCASGDGISAGVGSHNIKIDRCYLHSNDDGVNFWTSYNEKRGLTWWHSIPEQDNSVHDIEVCHCYINSGHGLTFIPWGTDDPDQSKVEMYNITAYDSVFGGGSSAVGGWFDNPYYGGTFDNNDTNDFSPMRDILIYNNKYLNVKTFGPATPVSVITDCGLYSAENFMNGDFERAKRKTWTAGLSYWTRQDGMPEDSIGIITVERSHHAYLKNFDVAEVRMWQGLYTKDANVTFTASVKTEDCTAKLFIIDSKDGAIVAELPVSATEFTEFSLTAALKTGTYYFGIAGVGGSGTAYFDNAVLTRDAFDSALYTSQEVIGYDTTFVKDFKMTETPGPESEHPLPIPVVDDDTTDTTDTEDSTDTTVTETDPDTTDITIPEPEESTSETVTASNTEGTDTEPTVTDTVSDTVTVPDTADGGNSGGCGSVLGLPAALATAAVAAVIIKRGKKKKE